MNKIKTVWWNKLSTGQKISLIGSITILGSLFLNWFSDVDVFRSGDTYTALNGPLSFIGANIFLICLANLAVSMSKGLNWKITVRLKEEDLGKYQMWAGFAMMYLVVLTNAIYFNPQFGLNVLSKKSEIGVMIAMFGCVMVCTGGYVALRKKYEKLEEGLLEEERPGSASVPVDLNLDREFFGSLKKETTQVEAVKEMAVEEQFEHEVVAEKSVAPNAPAQSIYSEKDLRGKTDYERAKMYDSLKKMMMKDTMSPEQRRKEREKELKENAFSANFGRSKPEGGIAAVANTGSKPAAKATVGSAAKSKVSETEKPAAKKPQMYRLDL